MLRLPADEVLPYDELSPEPTAVSERLGALFHLSQGTRFPALVLSLRALLRKVLPPSVMGALSALVSVGQDFDRDSLARKLASMGYQSSPLVEDPGTFSVRGGILDVFSPLYERPVRLEFFGDTIESIRAFDPETQRTVDSLKELYLVPAREVLLTEQTRPRAEAAARAVADRINLPTIKLRERLEALREGLPGFGMEGAAARLLRGRAGHRSSTTCACGRRTRSSTSTIPWAWTARPSELWAELERSFQAADERQELTLPPPEHFLTREQAEAQLAGSARAGGRRAGAHPDASSLRCSSPSARTQDLREAILAHHGEEGALTPLVERLQRWRETARGLRHRLRHAEPGGPAQAAAAGAQRDGAASTRSRSRMRRKLYEPSVSAHLFTRRGEPRLRGRLGRHWRVLADEEIFGVRARRRVATRARSWTRSARASRISRKATSSSTPTSASAATRA